MLVVCHPSAASLSRVCWLPLVLLLSTPDLLGPSFQPNRAISPLPQAAGSENEADEEGAAAPHPAAALPAVPASALPDRQPIRQLDPRVQGREVLVANVSGVPLNLTISIAGAPYAPRFSWELRRRQLILVLGSTGVIYASNVSKSRVVVLTSTGAVVIWVVHMWPHWYERYKLICASLYRFYSATFVASIVPS